MNKEITTTEQKGLISFSNEDMNIIKTQFFPQNATQSDIDYCMGVAKSLGLNPITKEIWFIERKAQVNGQWVSKIEPMAGRDSYIKVAHRSGDFGGIESVSELKEVPTLINGNWETKKDLIATAKVYKRGIDKPFIAEVNYNEYVQRTKDGKPTKFWNEKPHTMLKKVAESQALRKAFNITGIYDEAETRDDSDIQDGEIVLDEQSQVIFDLNQAKTKLATKLKKIGYSAAMIKDFAKVNELGDNADAISILLDDETLFNEALAKYEN